MRAREEVTETDIERNHVSLSIEDNNTKRPSLSFSFSLSLSLSLSFSRSLSRSLFLSVFPLVVSASVSRSLAANLLAHTAGTKKSAGLPANERINRGRQGAGESAGQHNRTRVLGKVCRWYCPWFIHTCISSSISVYHHPTSCEPQHALCVRTLAWLACRMRPVRQRRRANSWQRLASRDGMLCSCPPANRAPT